jgi:hypothetical protein
VRDSIVAKSRDSADSVRDLDLDLDRDLDLDLVVVVVVDRTIGRSDNRTIGRSDDEGRTIDRSGLHGGVPHAHGRRRAPWIR